MRGFLNSDLDTFIHGEYRGELLEDVVMDDPDYVEYIIGSDDHDMTDEEEEAMKAALKTYEDK